MRSKLVGCIRHRLISLDIRLESKEYLTVVSSSDGAFKGSRRTTPPETEPRISRSHSGRLTIGTTGLMSDINHFMDEHDDFPMPPVTAVSLSEYLNSISQDFYQKLKIFEVISELLLWFSWTIFFRFVGSIYHRQLSSNSCLLIESPTEIGP